MENSANLVKGDLEQVGRKVYEIIYNVPEKLPEGEGYWIKFLYRPGKNELSSHFMRKDKKSGRWIHKMGWNAPPKVCIRNIDFEGWIIKSEIEKDDSAGYISISQSEGVKKYVTLWAMRVSEP